MDKRAFDCWITCNYGNLIARLSRDEMLDEDCLQEAYLLTVGTRGFVPYEEYPLLLLRNYRRAKKRSVAHSFLHIHPDPLFFEFLHEEEGRLEETKKSMPSANRIMQYVKMRNTAKDTRIFTLYMLHGMPQNVISDYTGESRTAIRKKIDTIKQDCLKYFSKAI